MLFVFFCLATAANLASATLDQCITEYNSLLQQCQTEINRAGVQINSLAQQLDEQTARVGQLETEQLGLFSWRYVRQHVEYVFPEFKEVSIIPIPFWTQSIVPIIDQHIRPHLPFLFNSPPEDILLFLGLSSVLRLRLSLILIPKAKTSVSASASSCPMSKAKSA